MSENHNGNSKDSYEWWDDMSEVERIAQLENLGFEECGFMCPHCGTELLEREKEIWIGESDQPVLELKQVCPSCGYVDFSYDA